VAQHGPTPDALLDVLRTLEASDRGLVRPALDVVAATTGLPESRVGGVASFYSMLSLRPRGQRVVRVCDSPSCAACGGAAVMTALGNALGVAPGETTPDGMFTLERTSCVGLCDRAPALMIDDELFGPVAPEEMALILDDCRTQAQRGARSSLYGAPVPGEVRVVLARTGQMNPDVLVEARALGAYEGLERALQHTPDEVVEQITASGLQGRGGAGFPAGRKLRFVASETRMSKYIVCNADESEPGTFKDRVLMEADPHLLLEGIAIAGYAVGAHEGYIYIRGEYTLAAARLQQAILQAEAAGWLGKNVAASGFDFHIHLHRGAGAYICGEETALLESLEGRRGLPRIRPPYPTVSGLWGQPTLVNNVETLVNFAPILRQVPHAAQTKLFTVSGHVARPGAYEAPLGVTARALIYDFAGGMKDNARFKLAQTGGAAGTIIPEALLDVPLTYAAAKSGVALGSGALLVCDERVSAVELLHWLVYFFWVESCGKCTPCRDGTAQALHILDRLAAGSGLADDLAALTSLADTLALASFCGLGQSAALPIRSALAHFRDEFEAALGG
jgi:NADH:ubiquinone oxidoreductase subunit F (NADH-binding)/NADH:ubiquinone oxidoreductase subunit E